ncbi:MAG TPA: DUF3078 domain-containing protein [Edaphocola sp.]|nr:DUF3078 domain-containing protein [Edaphocola sp.]
MKKLLLLPALLLGISSTVSAQLQETETIYSSQKYDDQNKDTVAWLKQATFNLAGSQGMMHNWSAGGELSSFAVNGLFNGNVTRLYHRHVWSNTLDLAYGNIYQYSDNFQPRKNADKIDLTSKYGYRMSTSGNWYVTAILNARTQFSKGYSNVDYAVPNWREFSTSRFLSPLYVLLSPGIEYRRGEELSVFFSPVAARATFVDKYYTSQNPEGAFGVLNGKSARVELGAYFSARYVKDLAKNLSYRGRLDLYTNYLAKDIKDETGTVIKKDSPANIDVLFDNVFSYKFFKYFSANLELTAMYDNDYPYNPPVDANGNKISRPMDFLGWWQINQRFSLGFIYNF